MKVLGLIFRLDELSDVARAFAGTLDADGLNDVLPGLIGDHGYRPERAADISGQVYKSARREVVVTGRMTSTVGFDCVRCLSTRSLEIVVDGQYTLLKRNGARDAEKEIIMSDDTDDDDDGALYYAGDEVDLSDLYRQELILALPMNPTCENVDGVECANDALTFSNDGDVVDPRWAPLLELKKKLK